MSEKTNATCAICGKEYVMCYSCDKKDPASLWKMHCDTPNHYKVFQIINGYTSGVYTKEEAAAKLNNVDLSDLDALRDNIKAIIKDIQKAPKKVKVRKAIKEDDAAKTEEKVSVVQDDVIDAPEVIADTSEAATIV